MLRTLLGYTVAKVCTTPRNSTLWFTRHVFPRERVRSGDETIQ